MQVRARAHPFRQAEFDLGGVRAARRHGVFFPHVFGVDEKHRPHHRSGTVDPAFEDFAETAARFAGVVARLLPGYVVICPGRHGGTGHLGQRLPVDAGADQKEGVADRDAGREIVAGTKVVDRRTYDHLAVGLLDQGIERDIGRQRRRR